MGWVGAMTPTSRSALPPHANVRPAPIFQQHSVAGREVRAIGEDIACYRAGRARRGGRGAWPARRGCPPAGPRTAPRRTRWHPGRLLRVPPDRAGPNAIGMPRRIPISTPERPQGFARPKARPKNRPISAADVRRRRRSRSCAGSSPGCEPASPASDHSTRRPHPAPASSGRQRTAGRRTRS